MSADHLKSILAGMVGVTTEDSGTATFVFRGFPWQVAGKTGTAQNPGTKPHAWFGAIAPASRAAHRPGGSGGERRRGLLCGRPGGAPMLQAYLPDALKAATGSGPEQLTAPSR